MFWQPYPESHPDTKITNYRLLPKRLIFLTWNQDSDSSFDLEHSDGNNNLILNNHLLIAYCGQAQGRALAMNELIESSLYEADTTALSILQKRKREQRGWGICPGRTANQQWKWDLHPGTLAPEQPFTFHTYPTAYFSCQTVWHQACSRAPTCNIFWGDTFLTFAILLTVRVFWQMG